MKDVMPKKKGIGLTVLLVLAVTNLSGQIKTRLPVWTFNTHDTKVFGLSVGLTTTEKIKNVHSNGLRFELLGFGILLPLIPESPLAKNDSLHALVMKSPYAEKINGINLSPLGTGCDCKVNGFNIYGVGSITRQVNGISAGVVMNFAEVQNGIQGGLFFNLTYNLSGLQLAFISNANSGIVKGVQISALNVTSDLRGLQIGIYNRTTRIRGLQIGLWNVSEKRKRPIINF
jgi:hypothetical protein